MISINCTAVEDEVAKNMYQLLELDYLLYNDPVGNAGLLLNGDPEEYLGNMTDYSPWINRNQPGDRTISGLVPFLDKENHQLFWWEGKAYGYGQNKNFPILQVLDLLATTNELRRFFEWRKVLEKGTQQVVGLIARLRA